MIQLIASLSVQWTGELSRALTRARREAVKEQARVVATEAKRLFVGGRKSGRSRPGELPRRDSGNYRRSIGYKVLRSGMSAVVGPTVPKGAHAALLKYGTKRMKARLVPSEEALRRTRDRLTAPYAGRL